MIRAMTAADVPQIAAIEQQCFSDPWNADSIAYELTNPISHWLVAEENGAVLGYVGSQLVPPEADVMNLAVVPTARRKGLGRELMQTLLRDLSAQGIEALFLEVRESNLPAQTLYAALGFVEVGRRKKYYVNPMEDALILRKEVTASC